MNFGFSHLVVNGCSFTYCEGLDNPEVQGWPALLAAKMNVPVINLAICGAGNDRIFRTTLDHVYFNPLPNPLYIIGFSHASRREEYVTQTGPKGGHYKQIHMNQAKCIFDEFEKFFPINYDQLYYNKKKLQFWLGITNTLKANGITYLTTDCIPGDHIQSAELQTLYREIWSAVYSDPNKITDFADLCRNLPALPCGHHTASTMEILATFTYEEIRKRWGTK